MPLTLPSPQPPRGSRDYCHSRFEESRAWPVRSPGGRIEHDEGCRRRPDPPKDLLAALLLAFLSLSAVRAEAGGVVATLRFQPPEVTLDARGEARISMPGCLTAGDPGTPLLPSRGAALLLPPGERVRGLRVRHSAERSIEGTWRVAAAGTPQPSDGSRLFVETGPLPEIYESDDLHPSSPAALVTVERAWGHDIAFLRVRPLGYRPLSGRLHWHEEIVVEIETEPSGEADRLANLRVTPEVRARLSRLVHNPDLLESYDRLESTIEDARSRARPREVGSRSLAGAFPRFRSDRPGGVPTPLRVEPGSWPYVIVTAESLRDAFGPVAVYQSSRGLRAAVVTVEEIAGAYPGVDDAEKIRNFIKDAYQIWGTSFVLLGGDYDIVPVRRLYARIQTLEGSFPGEVYYEGLDGTWNTDGDSRWGEWNEWDLIGEVAVGRAPVETPAEVGRWLYKTRMYAEAPVVDDVPKGLFLGEQLDDVTWGDDYMEEVKDPASTHGYTTSGYPGSYLKQTLYDREGYDGNDVIEQINLGYATTHHLGHSGIDYVMKIHTEDLPALTNNGIERSFMVNYSQGCDPARFDYSVGDCIAEALILDEHGSAAFVGNTRYGFFFPRETDGPSQHFERQYVDACYDEGILEIGWMNVDSKTDNIWQLSDWLLWCHYDLVVLGDPALCQWREVAGTLELAHDGEFIVGEDHYPVTVTADGAPVEGAVVTVYSRDAEIWDSVVTGPDGVAALRPVPGQPMSLYLKAVKPDYLPGLDSLGVVPVSGPWLFLTAHAFDDGAAEPAVGDGDGEADAGEALRYTITLRNVGPDPAIGAMVRLRASGALSAPDSLAGCGTIDPHSDGSTQDDLVVLVSPQAGDSTEALLAVEYWCEGSAVCRDSIRVLLHAPVLTLASWAVDDDEAGDGDGVADPGEVFAIRVSVRNSGSDAAREVATTLSSSLPGVQVMQTDGRAPVVSGGATVELSPPFLATFAPDIPTDLEAPFDVTGATWCGQGFAMDFRIPIASFHEEWFELEGGWTAGVPGDNATQGIWTRVDPIGTWGQGNPIQPEDDHTPWGTMAFVTGQGQPGGSATASDVDGGRTTLLSPVFDLRPATDPRLVYWRWFTNNFGNWPNEDLWRVDLSSDGGSTWIPLESTTAGTNQWVRMEFRLADYINALDRVRVRFIASDEIHDSLVEAAVDDLSFESLYNPSGLAENLARPARFSILRTGPNPLILSSSGGGRAAPLVSRDGSGSGSAGGMGAEGLGAGGTGAGGASAVAVEEEVLPAGACVAIEYSQPEAGTVRWSIHDISGRQVRASTRAAAAPGIYRIGWDARDDIGRVVSPGVYFCRVQFGARAETAKLVLLLGR